LEVVLSKNTLGLLGVKVQKKTHCEEELRKTMARLAKVVLVDGNSYNFFEYN
jgi:hypothetical protein